MTVEEFYAMLEEVFLLERVKRGAAYEVWKDKDGMYQTVNNPEPVPFDERREILEELAKARMVELPPLRNCH